MSDNTTPARLRDALLDELVRQVEDGPIVPVKDDDGEVHHLRVSPSPQVMAQAIAYLKVFPPMDMPSERDTEKSATLARYADQLKFGKRA